MSETTKSSLVTIKEAKEIAEQTILKEFRLTIFDEDRYPECFGQINESGYCEWCWVDIFELEERVS